MSDTAALVVLVLAVLLTSYAIARANSYTDRRVRGLAEQLRREILHR